MRKWIWLLIALPLGAQVNPPGGTVGTSNSGVSPANLPPVSIVYVNTTFTEAPSGALAGTTPAVCANGCTGTWTQAGVAATPWAYNTASVTIPGNSPSCSSGGGTDNFCPVYINAGTGNYTLRFNLSSVDDVAAGALGVVLRWTDNANFITYVHNSSGWSLCDVVVGATSCGSATAFNEVTGAYTVIANGTTISLTNTAGTASGTVTSSNTGGKVGMNSTTNIGSALTMTSFKVSQN